MNRWFIAIACYLPMCFAVSLQDSVLEIPKGTQFKLRNELEIPANRNFILLGYNRLNETFNDINKISNQQLGRDYQGRGYYYYNDYLSSWMKTAEQSYQECIERHRVTYSYGGSGSSTSNTIVNQGHGNTNIIINQNTQKSPSYGSYIGDNSCIMPEHSAAVLMLDKNSAGAGGIFREGYVFKLTSVRHEIRGSFHIVTINFDHNIAKGVQIITTISPESISMNQLQYREISGGFWSTLGKSIASSMDIGGENFIIELPAIGYYN